MPHRPSATTTASNASLGARCRRHRRLERVVRRSPRFILLFFQRRFRFLGGFLDRRFHRRFQRNAHALARRVSRIAFDRDQLIARFCSRPRCRCGRAEAALSWRRRLRRRRRDCGRFRSWRQMGCSFFPHPPWRSTLRCTSGTAGCVGAEIGKVPTTRSLGTISIGYMPIGLPSASSINTSSVSGGDVGSLFSTGANTPVSHLASRNSGCDVVTLMRDASGRRDFDR